MSRSTGVRLVADQGGGLQRRRAARHGHRDRQRQRRQLQRRQRHGGGRVGPAGLVPDRRTLGRPDPRPGRPRQRNDLLVLRPQRRLIHPTEPTAVAPARPNRPDWPPTTARRRTASVPTASSACPGKQRSGPGCVPRPARCPAGAVAPGELLRRAIRQSHRFVASREATTSVPHRCCSGRPGAHAVSLRPGKQPRRWGTGRCWPGALIVRRRGERPGRGAYGLLADIGASDSVCRSGAGSALWPSPVARLEVAVADALDGDGADPVAAACQAVGGQAGARRPSRSSRRSAPGRAAGRAGRRRSRRPRPRSARRTGRPARRRTAARSPARSRGRAIRPAAAPGRIRRRSRRRSPRGCPRSSTSPAVPPYSSITIATWICLACISLSRSSTGLLSGTNVAGRMIDDRRSASRQCPSGGRRRSWSRCPSGRRSRRRRRGSRPRPGSGRSRCAAPATAPGAASCRSRRRSCRCAAP